MLDEKLSFEQTFGTGGATMRFDYRTSWATIPVDCNASYAFEDQKSFECRLAFDLIVNVTFVSIIEFENFFNS